MAGSRQQAVESVKYALHVQSHGGRIGRYYVQRTLEHLQQCNHYFSNNVKIVHVNLPTSASHAFRRFTFENIPQLRYRNPTTTFDFKFQDENPSELKICYADGKEEDIETNQKQSEIYNAFIELTKPKENEMHVDADEG